MNEAQGPKPKAPASLHRVLDEMGASAEDHEAADEQQVRYALAMALQRQRRESR